MKGNDVSGEQFTIVELPEEFRYVMHDALAGNVEVGEESYVDVTRDGTTERVLFHTGVSAEYGGLGLASQLVQEVVDHTVGLGYRIVPVCPYVKKWLMKHPEYADHVVAPTPEHLASIPKPEAS